MSSGAKEGGKNNKKAAMFYISIIVLTQHYDTLMEKLLTPVSRT